MACEFVTGDDDPAQFGSEFLQPGRQIYRGTNAGEIQPVAAANVAVQDLPKVERQSKTHATYLGSRRLIDRSDICTCLICGSQCASTNLSRVGVASDREDGQEAVAHELENFATMLEDRRNLTIKILVEQSEQGLRW